EKLPVSVVEPNPADVLRRSDVQMPAERQLHRADGDRRGSGYVGGGDGLVSVLVDVRQRAAQRGGGAVVPVLDGRLGDGVIREGGQGRDGQQPGRVSDQQRVIRGGRVGEHGVAHVAVGRSPHVG